MAAVASRAIAAAPRRGRPLANAGVVEGGVGCADAARAAGFTRYEMGATLTGARLFGVKGYVAVKSISIPLVNGESLPVIHMEKQG